MIDSAHGAAAGATPDPNSTTGCGLVENGQNGILSTPVIDPTTNTLYAVARSFENGYPVNRLHALDITTGNEKFGGPTAINASIAGSGTGSVNGVLTMDPKWANQRPGLLLAGSGATATLYIGFGSFCDEGPYHGWLLGYNPATLAQTYVFNSTPNGSEGAIWSSGAGISADTDGANGAYRLFFPTGNGSYDAGIDFGEGVLRLGPNSGGVFSLLDNFISDDQASWTAQDLDMGSAGTLILPDAVGPSATPHLAVQLNKAGEIFILNRDNLGGYTATSNKVVQDIVTGGLGAGLWGVPAYWNGNIYYWSSTDSLRQYSITNGLVSSSPIAAASQTECGNNQSCPNGGTDFGGSTPSISANGETNGIVWVDDWVATGNPTQNFYAYSAANVSTLLWSSNTNAARDAAGPEQKFTVPTIADGKVFLASRGQIQVYGLYTFTVTPSSSSVSVDPGGSTNLTLNLAAASGFAGGVTFAASGLPTGVTVTFAPNAGGAFTASFAAASTAAAGKSSVTITATYSTYSQTLIIPLAVGGFADFTIASISPASISIQPGGQTTTSVTLTSLGGFTGSVGLSIAGLPTGITTAISSSDGLTFTAASSTAAGVYALTVTATSGSLSHSASLLLTVSPTTGTLAVNLSAAYNAYAIFNDGSQVTNGGIDGTSYAYSGNFLSSALTWSALPFSIAQAGTPTAVVNKTVPLPAGSFGSLNLLAACSYGPFTGQQFVVTYTDGSTATTTLSISDWASPQFYSGESIIDAVANRIMPGGAVQSGPWYIYGYSLPLNSAKTVKSVSLPGTNRVFVLAMTLSQIAPAPLALFSIASPSPFTLAPGTGGTLGITITPGADFTGTPSLSLSSSPSGLSNAFINTTATGSELVLYATAGTVPATYPLIITGTYGGASQTAPLSVIISGGSTTTPKPQTMTFGPIPAQSVGATYTVSATASSGLPVTYSLVPNGNCSLSGSVVTLLNVGNCGVIATQAGNASYSAAPAVGQIIVVNNAAPSFTIAPSAATFALAPGNGSSLNFTATPASGFSGTVAYSLSGKPLNPASSGISYTFLQQSSTVSTLVIYVPAGETAGTYTITVTGTSGGTVATTTFAFKVA